MNAPVALGRLRLNAPVQEFLARYPAIAIELILNDRFADLMEEGVDVALRLGGPLPPDAVARKVALSPRYLARHDYIRFAWLPGGDELELHHPKRSARVATQGRYRVNNALAIRDSLAMGAGIGLCPHWLVDDMLADGRLVRVLPAWRGSVQELFLLTPSRRYQPLRARLFIDFIGARIARLPGFEAAAR